MPSAPPQLAAAGPAARPLLITGSLVHLDELLRLAETAGVDPTVAVEPAAARRSWELAPLVIVRMDLAEACIAAALPRRPGVVLIGDKVTNSQVWSTASRLGADHVVFLPEAERWLIDTLAGQARAQRQTPTMIGVVAGRRGAGASTLSVALALAGMRHGLTPTLLDADLRGGGLGPAFARLMPTAAGVLPDEQPPDQPRRDRPGRSDQVDPWDRLLPDRVQLPNVRGKAGLLDVAAHPSDLTVICWDPTTGPELTPAAMQSALATARSCSKLIIVDLPWQPDPAAAIALAACRTALVVLRGDTSSVATASRACAAVQRSCGDVRAVVRQGAPTDLPPLGIANQLGVPLAGVLSPTAKAPGMVQPPGIGRPGAVSTPTHALGDRLLAGLGLLDHRTAPGAS